MNNFTSKLDTFFMKYLQVKIEHHITGIKLKHIKHNRQMMKGLLWLNKYDVVLWFIHTRHGDENGQ